MTLFMGWEDYTNRFNDVRLQHNVMALVGNGFDIQVLSTLHSPTDTRYESFYHYLKLRKFDSSNQILNSMESLRGRAENWSDIEAAISRLHGLGSVSVADLVEDLAAIQREFSTFLDQVVTPEILSKLGEIAVAHELTMTSFTEFMGDIVDPTEYRKMNFPRRFNIGDLLNFKFINFNYTTLLDDFVYLDQKQFNPHPYKTSERNINFHPNPRGHDGDANWSSERQGFIAASYLVSEVVHPHGIQSTPRSLLFGIDQGPTTARELSKPYWAQNMVKYGALFAETDLFIIFGCSLGETDRWWWRAIVNAVQSNDKADVIIYRRQSSISPLTAHDLRKEFACAAGYAADPDILSLLTERTRVVLYEDSTERGWLNPDQSTKPSWAH